MKKIFLYILLAACPLTALAEHKLKEESFANETIVELRGAANLTWALPHNWSISLDEELRAVVLDKIGAEGQPALNTGAYFNKLYTTVEATYKPLSWLKIDAGMVLRITPHKYKDGQHLYRKAANEILRYRPFVSLGQSCKIGQWKLSLREKWQIDLRGDSINPLEKAHIGKTGAAMEMRYRLRADYTCRMVPLKPYASVEMTHTLNEPSCPWSDAAGKPLYGGQYINSVRAIAGLKWRLDKTSSLGLYYAYYWGKQRDINITTKKENVEITHTTGHTHVIGIVYEFAN